LSLPLLIPLYLTAPLVMIASSATGLEDLDKGTLPAILPHRS